MDLKVLFIPGWYPETNNPLKGIFIEKHIKSVVPYCKVGILYFELLNHPKGNIITTECSEKEGITKIVLKYKINRIRFLNRVINPIIFLIVYITAIITIFKKFGKPNITHLEVLSDFSFIAVILKKLFKIPYLVTEHSSRYLDLQYKGKTIIFYKPKFMEKILNKIIFSNSYIVTAVSEFLLLSLKNKFEFGRCQTIPNVVEKNIDTINKRDSNKLKIGVVSILKQDKDFDNKNIIGIIKSFYKLQLKNNNVELHIAGDGDLKGYLEKYCKKINILGKNIFFHGYIPNEKITEFLRSVDIYVLNSYFETFSVVAAEAIANGLPVITTNCGGPEEFVTSDVGIIVEKGNVQSLLAGMEQMIKNIKTFDKAKMSEKIMSKYESKTIGEMLFNVYKKIIID